MSKFIINTKTLTLEPISEIPESFKITDDYVEEMIDTTIIRSQVTFFNHLFGTKVIYIFGNRSGYWDTPDFYFLSSNDEIIGLENKRGKPNKNEIKRFIKKSVDFAQNDFCKSRDSSLRLNQKECFINRFVEAHSRLSKYREIVYFIAFLYRCRYDGNAKRTLFNTAEGFFEGNEKKILDYLRKKQKEELKYIEMTDLLINKMLNNLIVTKMKDSIYDMENFTLFRNVPNSEATLIELFNNKLEKNYSGLDEILSSANRQIIWLVKDLNLTIYKDQLLRLIKDNANKSFEIAKHAKVVKYRLYSDNSEAPFTQYVISFSKPSSILNINNESR